MRPRRASGVEDDGLEVLAERPPASGTMQLAIIRRIEATGLPWRVRDRKSGIVLSLCPPGATCIGSGPDEVGHQPDETIAPAQIGRPFWLGETAVTQDQWERIMGRNPSVHPGGGLPVDNITAWDCLEFCKRLGKGFRFPNEVEWEYACRAGSSGPFSHADSIDAAEVNFNGRYPYLHSAPGIDRRGPVNAGSLPPNRWGFHEMHGNVWEWCSALKSRVVTIGEHAIPTVIRGGSWGNHAHSCRCASRLVRQPDYHRKTVGFRVARDVGGPSAR